MATHHSLPVPPPMSCLKQITRRSRLRPACSCRARPWRPHSTHAVAAARPVPVISASDLDLETFRQQAFLAEKPLVIKKSDGGTSTTDLPAATRWFEFGTGAGARLSAHLQDSFAMVPLPYELMLPQRDSCRAIDDFLAWLQHGGGASKAAIRPALAELLARHIAMAGGPDVDDTTAAAPKLVRFEAPLALMLAAVEFNQGEVGPLPLTQLYIAQAELADLPAAMQADVPAPALVRAAGRGDVYASSLWLGLAPTYTPWHRDPNPNVFVQLCSRKTVRVMPPRAGERIFRAVQTELMRRQTGEISLSPSSRIRGEEMMQGPERELLHAAVWGPAAPTSSESTLQEACLDAGDTLFIPKGWWHSVKSAHADGRLNGSVNWWFR